MSSASALLRTDAPQGAPRALAPQGAPRALAPQSAPRAYAPQLEEPQSDGDAADGGAPEPQPPVPFILLLLLVGAGVLAVLPLVGACSFRNHRVMLVAGAALVLPLAALGAVLYGGGRTWLLARFFEGEYSEGATARQLPLLWYPEQVQILQYTTGEHAGRTIETYAAWETTAIVEYVETVRGGDRDGGSVVRDRARDKAQAGGGELRPGCPVRIRGLKKAPELNGMRASCQEWLAAQGRWRVELCDDYRTKDVKPENLHALSSSSYNFKVTIPASFGTDLEVAMDSGSNGALSGRLPFAAEFDGSAIVAKSGRREGQAWRKAGYWRLDFVTKVLAAMAVVGLEAMFVAAVLPPGVASEGDARLPLKAVYLVDGSDSISPVQWQAALAANRRLVAEFAGVYSSDKDKLNFGFVQFADRATVELPITNDMAVVTTMLDSMQQTGGQTYFDLALRNCQQLLDDYTEAGPKTFDVCVLITDGNDGSFKTVADLKGLVAKDTAIFGIYVGSDPASTAKLHQITGCGQAAGKEGDDEHGCDFFASATDFHGLALKAREVAEDVARGSDLVLCAERSAFIEGPFLVCLALPYLLWYLSCCTATIAKRRIENKRKYGSYDLLMLRDSA